MLNYVSALCVLVVLISPVPLQGQTAPPFDALLAEIASLKSVIAEHGRQIAELEAALRRLQSTASQESGSTIQTSTQRLRYAAANQWKIASSWDRLRIGMSQAQVVAILGQPTSIRYIASQRMLFYQGNIPAGQITGTIEISDDRVYSINKPIF
jgi:hypothetical protein